MRNIVNQIPVQTSKYFDFGFLLRIKSVKLPIFIHFMEVLMRTSSLLILSSVLLLSSCQANYGNVTPMSGNVYRIVSQGDTKQDATAKALAGAEQECKKVNKTGRFTVSKQEEKYVGRYFPTEQAYMQAKNARDLVKTAGVLSGNVSTTAKANSATTDYFSNAFETSLTFSCQ